MRALKLTFALVLVLLPVLTAAAPNVAPSAATWTLTRSTDAWIKGAFQADATTFRMGGVTQSTSDGFSVLQIAGGTPAFSSLAGYLSTTDSLSLEGYESIEFSRNFSFGNRYVTAGSEEYGVIGVRYTTGGAYWSVNNIGEASAVTNINAALQLTAGTNTGNLVVVGFADDTGDAGLGDIWYSRRSADTGAISGSAAYIGIAGAKEVAYAVAELSTGNVIIGGYAEASSDKAFYIVEANQDGAVQSTFAGFTDGGNNDIIRDIYVDGSDNVFVAGVTGTAGSEKGYVAKYNSSYSLQWEYTTTATGVEFYSMTTAADGDIVVAGYSGDDIIITVLADSASSAEVDWSQTYDLGQTGDIAYKIIRLSDDGYLVTGQQDNGGTTQGVAARFPAPAASPELATTPSPANAATDQSEAGVTLSWSTDGNGDSPTAYDVYFENVNPPTAIIGDDIAITTQSTGAINLGTTYYWRIVTFDADGDSAIGPVWSFSTPSANPIRVEVAADLNSTAWLDTVYAGFGGNGTDGYDSGIDIPKPPFSTGDLRMYIENTSLTSYEQILREEYRASTGIDDTTLIFTLKADITTAASDIPLSLTFDATTDNADSYGMVLYSVAQDTFQNLVETATFDTTANDGESHVFALLIGDITPPRLAFTLPDTTGGNRQLFPRSTTTTMVVDFDNSNPIRRVVIQFDSSSADADNWVTLTNANPVLLPTDDPTDGISNPTMNFDWNPLFDDNALFSSSDLFPLAQLRFIPEDWAGNKDTIVVDIEISPDEFDYPDDAPNATASAGWGAGWHLISLPLEPDAPTDPDSVFSEISGSFFEVFDGDVPASSVELMKGYWLLMDAASATSPATIYGSVDTLKAFKMSGIGWHLVGPAVRDAEVTGNLTFDDLEVSSDSSTWVDLTTDAGTLVGATLYSYDNDAGAQVDETPSDFTGTMTPGWGYQILTKAATTYIRMSQSFVNSDEAPTPGVAAGKTTSGAMDELEWFVPITISMRPLDGGAEYFVETISGVGGKTGASDGVDNFDKAEPPRPPTGKYARVLVDHVGEVAWSRYFVVDYRAPFSAMTTEASWDFTVKISEASLVSVGFDGTALEETYGIPESFQLSAVVTLPDGQTIQYDDILQTRELSFPYEGDGDVSITVIARLNGLTGVEGTSLLPTEYKLEGAYPNPFNPSTNLRVALPDASDLTVKVFNVLGKEVATLANGRYNAGYHMFSFDASNLASGVYFVRATVPGHLSSVRKLVLTR